MSNILKDNSRNKKRLFTKKISHRKKIIIIIVLAVVVLGSVAAYFIYSGFFNNKKSTTSDGKTSTTVSASNLTTKATAVVAQSGYTAGQTYLDKVLDTSSSSDDKAAVYLSKASLASVNSSTQNNSDTVEAAIQYSIKADELSPSADTALAVASYSERQKDYETAIKYYKLYLSRISKTDIGYEGYESHIKYLESKVSNK